MVWSGYYWHCDSFNLSVPHITVQAGVVPAVFVRLLFRELGCGCELHWRHADAAKLMRFCPKTVNLMETFHLKLIERFFFFSAFLKTMRDLLLKRDCLSLSSPKCIFFCFLGILNLDWPLFFAIKWRLLQGFIFHGVSNCMPNEDSLTLRNRYSS